MPIATMIADELAEVGQRVDVVGNGAVALDSLREYRPDLVVLPRVNGWDFVEHCREIPGGETIPMIVVSAARAITRSMEALGIRRFCAKPFDVVTLTQAANDVLRES